MINRMKIWKFLLGLRFYNMSLEFRDLAMKKLYEQTIQSQLFI